MSENVYNPEISYWYDAIMEAGYNPSDHKAAADSIVKILGPRKKVLELGIGTGLLAEQLVKNGIELSGFDFSPGMLKKAAARLGKKVKLYQQDVLTLNLPDIYEAAVSQGGVWVAVKNGTYLDSHITGYEKNLQALKRVAKYLDKKGLLIINIGPEQRDLKMKLANGAEYIQKVRFLGEKFEKDYFVKKDGKVVAHQHVIYARFNPEVTAKIIGEAGFIRVGIDKSKSFVIYQKR